MPNSEEYGDGDSTFQAAGGEEGIERLVDTFYCQMESEPAYSTIWMMHSARKEVARSRLSAFLCGWMGGPRLYNERFGSIRIPAAHAHIAIGHAEKKQWLSCMDDALSTMKYPDSLVKYLMTQFEVPAERIRLACESNQPT